MKITKENACIRVETPAAELTELGLDEEDFCAGSTGAQIFISAVIAMLRAKGITGSRPVAVTSYSDGRLILRLYYQPEDSELLYCFAHGGEVETFCRDIKKKGERLISSQIYSLNGRYWLILKTASDKSPEGFISDPVICAKIKEYGRLLCDTPINKLF